MNTPTQVGLKRMGDVHRHFKRARNTPVTVSEKTVPQFESVLGTQLHIELRKREMMTITSLKRNLIENSTLVKEIDYFKKSRNHQSPQDMQLATISPLLDKLRLPRRNAT